MRNRLKEYFQPIRTSLSILWSNLKAIDRLKKEPPNAK
jgi:hypothetical protein